MDRRNYLAAFGVGVLGSLAGCAGYNPELGATPTSTETATPNRAVESAKAAAAAEIELPVPESEIDRVLGKDGIPAITDPAFAEDWSSTEYELQGTNRVIGVKRDGEARAYPMRILNWHEVVNDNLGGPLLVTFCPLCGSGVTGVRTVDGEETQFGVSGKLWMSDLVMYDAKTESLWSQIRAQAIQGPKTGERIELLPSTLTTLEAWRGSHPDTKVLLPPPKSGTVGSATNARNYARDPYGGYENSNRIGIGRNDFDDDRLHPKTQVIGIRHDGIARAYPLPRITEEGVVNDEVNGLPVVVTTDSGGSLVAYDRRVDGATLSFEPADERHIRADGSRWDRVTGEAVDGPYEGVTLDRANDVSPKFWFAWAEFNPDTEIYGQ